MAARSTLAFLAFAALVFLPAPSAEAKCGPNVLRVRVSGAGLPREIALSPWQWGLRRETHPAASNALNGIGFGSAEPPLRRRPAEISELGPRYLLRYDLVVLDRRGRPAGNEMRMQYLFPYATGAYGSERPFAFTPRQTWEWGCGTGPERLAGPWWMPFPPDQVRLLERFGLQRPHDPESAATSREQTTWLPVAAATAVGVLLVGLAAIRSRARAARARRAP